ncbi:uncharacterized protein XM38_018850 [Halomicronema hongdechloris C2206]|uniref:Spermatogenesis-associated protein 20-like TRX domain-containing protein n=1 Tax=Halomicronema hongdechloris C2206 TaxID=1641165 RepID=A0A1Z3HLG7_9CYAN|nr:thioredoxin domain-containing protein [Halomicronema hongdechloris]ASC70937.1 uncharacterized protein XM38_018850 [Halomicronema hongdechloris C2206]
MSNRLAQCQSLYLRKHADNPIDWWPWCDDALAAARQENKPIFLSIGYSSCHWCTVMEGEAFSDEAVASYMNAYFLPIKVDREERPDLDSIYMQALQMITGQGGWPLNVFLAPNDLIPFYGGTYFPLEARYGRPAFLQVLQALRQFYDTEGAKVAAVKSEIINNLQQAAQLPTGHQLSPELLARGLATSARILAPAMQGTCFPMIPYANAALRGQRLTEDEGEKERHLCRQRGLDLAMGGIYDHVGGGFHRYTVDPTWTVPHFEKMLYDNGQIMEYLANLSSLEGEMPVLQRAVAGTVGWLRREMTDLAGYFYAAQDADSFLTPAAAEPEEGAFYVWRYEELQQSLSQSEFQALAEEFYLREDGNFDGQIVLQRQQAGPLGEAAEAALSQLFAQRYGGSPEQVSSCPPATDNPMAKGQSWPGRIPPVTDTKMIVAWNSLMISGLARAAAVFAQPDYLQLASKAAGFISQRQRQQGRFYRLNYGGEATVLAQAEDYALAIKALLDLQQAELAFPDTLKSYNWLAEARSLQAEFDQCLWSPETGGYYNTPPQTAAQLLVRERSYQDNAVPSANGIAIANLVRLFLLTEDLQYLDRAEQGLKAFSQIMAQLPQACPSLFIALDWFSHPTLVRTTADGIPALLRQYCPTAVFRVEDDLPNGAVGLVCAGLSCQEPAQNWQHLQQQLQQQMGAPA